MSEHNSRLMSIGEVAKSLHITRRMILNYEDKGILLPDVKTGSGGNRYYTPETLTRIRAIRRLQTLGISLDEIKLYFEDAADLRDIIARLEKLRDELNLCIEKLQLRVRENSNEAPIIRTIPPQTVYVYRCPSPTVEDRKEIFRDVIPAAMRQYGTDSAKRMYFIDYPIDEPNDINFCVAVPDGSKGPYVQDWPEEKALCIFFHGDYDEIPEVREHLVAYARQQGLKLKGTCRNIYLEGPPHHKDKSKFVTQVALPLVPDEL